MPRITTLTLTLTALILSLPIFAQAQEFTHSIFENYQITKAEPVLGLPTDPGHSDLEYAHQSLLSQALETDLKNLFHLYLRGELPARAKAQTEIQNDSFLIENLPVSSSDVLVKQTLLEIQNQLPESKLARAIVDSRNSASIIPIHFRIYDDEDENELSAYYDRGTHRVKMALDRVAKENWYTWFAHEHLHFFDPILKEAEASAAQVGLAEQIQAWIIDGHTQLSPTEKDLLNKYLSGLTHLSIQAEWRAWIATTLFAQNAMHAGLITQVPPCLSFLAEFGFGTRDLTVSELKQIWWKKLKAGFYVTPTGLFTNEWLKSQLLAYVDSLDPAQLLIPDLLDLVQ